MGYILEILKNLSTKSKIKAANRNLEKWRSLITSGKLKKFKEPKKAIKKAKRLVNEQKELVKKMKSLKRKVLLNAKLTKSLEKKMGGLNTEITKAKKPPGKKGIIGKEKLLNFNNTDLRTAHSPIKTPSLKPKTSKNRGRKSSLK